MTAVASITFLGAAKTVTGSKHLLTAGDRKILIDCGLYQGLKQLRLKNWEAFPERESSIGSIVLTHGHIDHTGFIPRLVKAGFSGRIYATPPTSEILKIMLPDSARLQEEEAKYANKEGFSRHAPALPLYNREDAERALTRVTPLAYDTEFAVAPGITMRYREAGHILGSAIVEFFIETGKKPLKVVFSGDLGRTGTPLLQDPSIISEADYLVLESTYGDRLHQVEDRKEALARVVKEAARNRGVLLIPAFAVERTQEILYILNLLNKSKEIPFIPIYIDSPMAISITKIFSHFSSTFDEEARQELLASGQDVLGGKNVFFTGTVEQSKAINSQAGPMIILSASGMATGGRILHHLKNRLGDPANTILLVGYQAVGTRGKLLQEGAKKIKIHGEQVSVKARIVSIDGFSSHADWQEILSWLHHFKKPPGKIFLVHGEEASQLALRKKIEEQPGWEAAIPEYLQKVDLVEGKSS